MPKFVYTLLILVSLAAPLAAQSVSGQIAGTVFDSSGALVPGAAVTVRNTGTGQSRSDSSNVSGYYLITDLMPGVYDLTVDVRGFKRYVESGITLNARTKLTVNATLTPGELTETVQVTAVANQVETSSGEVGDVITNRQVSELSLNGRKIVQLLQLMPGVTVTYTTPFNLGVDTGGQSINGMRGNTMGYMLDGAWNLPIGSNSGGHVTPNIDSVQEVKVSSTAYSAEYGHSQGAQINVITKSGTRDFHGVAYEFLRNDKLDANSWTSNRAGAVKPPLRYNEFGFNVGGPVFIPGKFNSDRSKLFFFIADSWMRYPRGNTVTSLVPTAEERRGDFTNSTLSIPTDPQTRQPISPSSPRVLPASLFSKNGPLLLKPIPLPNTSGPGYNYVTQTRTTSPQDQQMYRGDYNISPRTQLFVRGARDKFDATDGASGSTLGIVGATNVRKGVIWSANLSHTFSPRVVNVFAFSWSGTRINNFPVVDQISSAGLGLTFPKLYPVNRYAAAPDLSLQGFAGYNVGTNLQNLHHMFLWRDDLSLVRGNHALKFGVWIERYRANANALQSAPRDNGSVTFNRSGALSTGNPMADLLLGRFQSYSESTADSVIFARFTEIEAYAQDTWRIRPNLSIEAGLRYVIAPPVNSALNNIVAFRPQFYDRSKAPRFNADGSIVRGVGDFIGDFYVNGISLPGEGWPEGAVGRVAIASDPAYNRLFRGVPKGLSETRYNNLSPRLSLAWDPSGKGDWSIRAGGGITYDRIRNGSTILAGLGTPFVQRTTLFDANIDRPAGGSLGPLFPSALTTWSPIVKTPTMYSFSVGAQRRLPASMLGEVRYVSTLARYVTMGVNLNELPLGIRLLPGNGSVPRDSLRPYPGYSDITWLTAQGGSTYHGLQTSLQRRFTSGFGLGLAYTWSKVITNAFGEQNIAPQDSYNLRAERAPADWDRAHVLVVNYVWEIPLFKGRRDVVGKILGGWEVSGISNFATGTPANPSFSLTGDPTGTGKTSSRPDLVAPIQYLDPRQDRTFTLPNGRTMTGSFFFDPTVSFRMPPTGRYGNSSRNVLRAPGMNQWDVSLFKNFPIGEKARVQFRAESFNFFNHTQFSAINAGLAGTNLTSTFGQVTATAPPRQVQLGLKLVF
jgi:hypothetical protein